jgi:phosphatidylinositol alpha-1,6-mannosyltransferase
MRLLVLLTDAFGGRGGIAKFNRDLLRALTAHPECEEVVALPRVISDDVGPLPPKLTLRTSAAGSKARFIGSVLRHAGDGHFDAIICGHIHLVPAAAFVQQQQRAPVLLVTHGVEAWQPPKGLLRRSLARRVDAFVAVSELTKRSFVGWAGLDPDCGRVIPNCVSVDEFTPGPKDPALLQRYGLAGRRILLTLARLPSRERYKGVDETLEILPALAREIPSIAYLVVGDGHDRPRLEAKAAALGIADRVVFAGYVPEAWKVAHYRLADAFVMPGRGEGFGIVYLEALACGIPVIASTMDGSREALRNGMLGQLVDPSNPSELKDAIRTALGIDTRLVPPGLDFFSVEQFTTRWHAAIDGLLAPRAQRE